MLAQVIPIRPQRAAVSELCRWSESVERLTATNLRLWFAWQRTMLRAVTGV